VNIRVYVEADTLWCPLDRRLSGLHINMDVLTINFQPKDSVSSSIVIFLCFFYRKPYCMFEYWIQRPYKSDQYILLDHIHIYSTAPARSANRDSCGCPWGRSLCAWRTWSSTSQLLPVGPLHAVPTGNATCLLKPSETTFFQINLSITKQHVTSFHKS